MKKLGVELPGAVDREALAAIEPSHRVVVNGQFYWASNPQRAVALRASPHSYSGPVRDPTTCQWFSPSASSPRRDLGTRIFYFISFSTAAEFDRDPEGGECSVGRRATP